MLQGIERYNIKTLEHYVVDLQARETYWLEQYGWKATGAGLVNVSSQEEIIKTPVSTWCRMFRKSRFFWRPSMSIIMLQRRWVIMNECFVRK